MWRVCNLICLSSAAIFLSSPNLLNCWEEIIIRFKYYVIRSDQPQVFLLDTIVNLLRVELTHRKLLKFNWMKKEKFPFHVSTVKRAWQKFTSNLLINYYSFMRINLEWKRRQEGDNLTRRTDSRMNENEMKFYDTIHENNINSSLVDHSVTQATTPQVFNECTYLRVRIKSRAKWFLSHFTASVAHTSVSTL